MLPSTVLTVHSRFSWEWNPRGSTSSYKKCGGLWLKQSPMAAWKRNKRWRSHRNGKTWRDEHFEKCVSIVLQTAKGSRVGLQQPGGSCWYSWKRTVGLASIPSRGASVFLNFWRHNSDRGKCSQEGWNEQGRVKKPSLFLIVKRILFLSRFISQNVNSSTRQPPLTEYAQCGGSECPRLPSKCL